MLGPLFIPAVSELVRFEYRLWVDYRHLRVLPGYDPLTYSMSDEDKNNEASLSLLLRMVNPGTDHI